MTTSTNSPFTVYRDEEAAPFWQISRRGNMFLPRLVLSEDQIGKLSGPAFTSLEDAVQYASGLGGKIQIGSACWGDDDAHTYVAKEGVDEAARAIRESAERQRTEGTKRYWEVQMTVEAKSALELELWADTRRYPGSSTTISERVTGA